MFIVGIVTTNDTIKGKGVKTVINAKWRENAKYEWDHQRYGESISEFRKIREKSREVERSMQSSDYTEERRGDEDPEQRRQSVTVTRRIY